ncbi:Uncharacterized protein ChrSV_1073 [Chromobacterium vaccinii]|nr:Uncharacterized protein ChrSW_1073 [Chromobacterium vaccinii]QND88531.1 Uncharacterized protein ChrSV_1073 [Chromobacterium vaccinii]
MTYPTKSQYTVRPTLSTDEFATAVGMRPQSIRKSYSRKGHALGIRPIKLPNGKLRWPLDHIEQLIPGAQQ